MRLADLALMNAERVARRPVALVTDLAGGDQRVVTLDAMSADPLGTVLAERVQLDRSGVVSHDGREVFVSLQVPSIRLVVVGAVHIAQALATMAVLTELDVTVVDPRTAFANPERFPGVRILAEWPDDVLPALALDAYTAVALLTHDPKIDDQALIAAMRADCFYVGALGSRKTHGRRLDRMRAHGFDEEDLARIHAPVGLDIGAVSPSEIAVAILGEIIAVRRRKPKRPERDVTTKRVAPEVVERNP